MRAIRSPLPATSFPAAALAAFALAGVLTAAPAVPALAQAGLPPPVVEDQVTLSLTVEDWVRSETAKVALTVDAAGQGTEAATLRDELAKAARAVADKADWRIVSLVRQPDNAGLDRWHAVIEARLPEAQLANLGDRVKKASRPGLQVQVGGVDFEPTLAEIEAARGELRARVYKQVDAELDRLKAAFPDRAYRVGRIDFGEEFMPMPEPRHTPVAVMAEVGGAAPAVGPGVQDRLRLTARVALSAFAVPPKP